MVSSPRPATESGRAPVSSLAAKRKSPLRLTTDGAEGLFFWKVQKERGSAPASGPYPRHPAGFGPEPPRFSQSIRGFPLMITPCVRPGPSPPHLEGGGGPGASDMPPPGGPCSRMLPRPATGALHARRRSPRSRRRRRRAAAQRRRGPCWASRLARSSPRAATIAQRPSTERTTLGAKEPSAAGDIVLDYV